MSPSSIPKFSVSEFVAICNQTLDYAYHGTTIIGEVASFKVNQGKWVFFDLRDDSASISCFLPLFQLRTPLVDGMKVAVKGYPKLTSWGKFSFTTEQILPVGEGSIKKSFELLKAKLTKEGLFDSVKKRPLPSPLRTIGVISSTQAAGYADFIKILNERWGGLSVQVAHTGVQGLAAADQIIAALNYFNQRQSAQVIVIIRGGGSADDLALFNDEKLVRAIAASRIPTLTGIGHEVDETLADLAADLRASTPSNAAQFLTPDRRTELARLHDQIAKLKIQLITKLQLVSQKSQDLVGEASRILITKLEAELANLTQIQKTLARLDPELILAQGYAIVTGEFSLGSNLKITTASHQLTAEIKQIKER